MTLNDLIQKPLQAEQQGVPVNWKQVAVNLHAAACSIIESLTPEDEFATSDQEIHEAFIRDQENDDA